MWRYEQPQKGRLREFYQISVELFGTKSVDADFEIITLAIECLKNLGLNGNDFVIRVNNRKFLQGFIEGLGITDYEAIFRVIDNYTKSTKEEFVQDLESCGLSNEQVSKVVSFMGAELSDMDEIEMNPLMREGYLELSRLFSMFESLGYSGSVQFSSFIARGLSYYTGTVFECFDREGKFRAILGGGRYDNMVSQFGGQATPAVGFAIGDVTLELLLREKKLWPEEKVSPDYYICYVNDTVKIDAYKIAQKLRAKYVVDIDISERKLGKQLAYANSISAKHVVIVGEDELKEGLVVVRDMGSGHERKIGLNELFKDI
jgi:histidyl-tRNA synthetase